MRFCLGAGGALAAILGPFPLSIAQAMDASVRAKLPRYCIHMPAKP
jgi:hypothetical protein